MTGKTPAADRIVSAHTRLLDSVRITPRMPLVVQEALVDKADSIESLVLACLVGRLAGLVSDGKPLAPTKLAAIVEDVCAKGIEDAADLIAKTEAKGNLR